MRLGDEGSSNFEDRTGQSGGGGFGFGGGGGGMGGGLGLILSLIASRFGIVGVIVLMLGYCALSSLGGGGGGGVLGGSSSAPTAQGPAGQSTLSVEDKHALLTAKNSTDQVWSALFQRSGVQYQPTQLVAYSRGTQSGCGNAQSAMGPFYCPTDKKIYIDPEFFTELRSRFNAPGDFPEYYVIAHEVGHHIQDLEGTLDKASAAQARGGEAQGNQIQVGIELQADCYAGVWAANATAPDGTKAIDPGDLEEGLKAASAIGDDTLQQQAQGRVVPESFTHGSSDQRMEALRRGLTTGNPASCNYNRV